MKMTTKAEKMKNNATYGAAPATRVKEKMTSRAQDKPK